MGGDSKTVSFRTLCEGQTTADFQERRPTSFQGANKRHVYHPARGSRPWLAWTMDGSISDSFMTTRCGAARAY